jgi:SAM-dependent methyltransferase
MEQKQNNVTIYEGVQDRYGKIAQGVNSSCCGESSDCGNANDLYGEDALANLPVDVTGLSLGCGDPVSIASLREGETVLDLGSGGGIDCFLAAQRVGAAGYVIGVDMTDAMLEKANANKARMGVTNVDFRKGQIEDMPVDDDSVDVILSNCVINLSPQKADVFSEAIRVLKPGGRVAISDIVTEGEFSEELRADINQWAECVTGAIDVEAYTGLMRDAGFVNIQVVDKADAADIVPLREGMPRVYSARITANKPE